METYILYFVKAGLALMILFAGAAKLALPGGFESTVSMLGLRKIATKSFSTIFALLECSIAAISIVANNSRVGDWMVLGLICVFALANGVALARHRAIPCNCFGSASTRGELGARGLAETSLMAAIAIYILIRRPTLEPATYASSDWASIFILVALAATIVVVGQATKVLSILRGR